MNEDTERDFVVVDLLEEICGTVNAGRGFFVTYHDRLRRKDGVPLIERLIGSEEHRSPRLSTPNQLSSAIEASSATLLVLDIDAARRKSNDWDWLRIPQPTETFLSQWHHRVHEACDVLKSAIWFEETDRFKSLASTIELAAGDLASVVAQSQRW
ncbi:hypothetical protein [Brevibacterium sp. CFH 10365]|uniref:hypothetical protein n=1 Tax=Brevibacterium sp. CFH 10365 TaxID=2585207 RepID=UPI00126633C8|nr:hypothetical protein [Brevibacterium sp. CFH 10365]